MPRQLVFVALSLSLLACKKSSPPQASQAPPASSPPASSSAPAQASAPAASSSSPAGSVAVGFVPTPPSKDADETNRKALARHKKGDFSSSRRLFAQAAELSPGVQLYRYNLACAHARLGELGEATALLRRLLVEDLTRFRDLLAHDSDLEALRASPAGVELQDEALRLSGAYLDAAARGVPMVYWRGYSTSQVQLTSLLRPGVYLPGEGRFVALAAVEEKAIAAFVDVGRREIVYMAGEISDCKNDFCPKSYGWGVFVYPWLAAARSVSHFARPPEDAWFTSARVEPVGGGARALFSTPGRPASWKQISHEGAARAERQGEPEGPWFLLSPSGVILGRPHKEFRRSGARLALPDGRTIDLGKGHAGADAHALVVSPDAKTAVAVSNHLRCECEVRDQSISRHVISKIDLASGQVEQVASGNDEGAADFDREGNLYLQSSGALRRWPDQPLPPGLLLTVPHQSMPHCCGL